MKNFLNRLLEAAANMALADPEYWLARQYLADPDAADLVSLSLIADLEPSQRIARESSDDHARSEAPDAVAEVEALLAAARDDLVRSA